MKTDTELMDDFFATHSYNRSDDWRKEPATAVDPDEEVPEGKKAAVVRLEEDKK